MLIEALNLVCPEEMYHAIMHELLNGYYICLIRYTSFVIIFMKFVPKEISQHM